MISSSLGSPILLSETQIQIEMSQGEMAECSTSGGGSVGGCGGLEQLPSALLATIMTKLDVGSICAVASTCRTFRVCASHILSFLPSFHLFDIAPSMHLLAPLLPPNPYLKSLKVNCCRLDDAAIDCLVHPSLQDLSLFNCCGYSGKLLSEIGMQCPDLRALYISSLAEKRGRSVLISDLEDLLSGCVKLETLNLMFDVSVFLRHGFPRAWMMASPKLTSLEIGYISVIMVIEMLSPAVVLSQSLHHSQPAILPNLQKLCLSVDYITDTMVSTLSKNLPSLIHLDLRDAPVMEPKGTFDLSNAGLQHINEHGKLKHLSLVRSHEYLDTYFRRVNDLGILMMADRCASMESISLGGFCRVTDTGFRALLHTCTNLYKLKVFHGTHLTDLVFLDISATSLSLTHVTLRWCTLLTNLAVAHLSTNLDLTFLDLRDCRNLGDEALAAVSILPELKVLLVDNSDISDMGMSHLSGLASSTLITLSVRGCKRLTDKCIDALFGNSITSKLVLQELDLSNLPNLSDEAILFLARSRVPIREIRMRHCPLIGDTSVMALASMQVDDERWHGNSLRVMDLYNCGRITALAFKWLKRPYFPRLKWLGINGSVNRDMADALARNRPYLHVACRGEELGSSQWDHSDNYYGQDYEEIDELEEWLMEGDSDDEEMLDDDDMEG